MFGPRYLLSKLIFLTQVTDQAKNLNHFTKALHFSVAVHGVPLSLFILGCFQGLRSANKSTTSLSVATNLEGYNIPFEAFEDCCLSKN